MSNMSASQVQELDIWLSKKSVIKEKYDEFKIKIIT